MFGSPFRFIVLLLAGISLTFALQARTRTGIRQSWTVTPLHAWTLPSPPTHTFNSLEWYQEIPNPCQAPDRTSWKSTDYEDDSDLPFYASVEWSPEELQSVRPGRWARISGMARRVVRLFV